MKRLGMWVLGLLGLLLALLLAVWLAFQLSPQPGVQLIRWIFGAGAAESSAALVPLLPPGVQEQRDIEYQPGLRLDIYRPPGWQPGQALPTLVWVHGGGWVSGRKEDLRNYLHIVAARGFAVVNVDYTLAPEGRYPTQPTQINAALAFLQREAARLQLDLSRVLMGGDSAGSQLVAQTALLQVHPEYAARMRVQPALRPEQLRGLILFCGVYDFGLFRFDGKLGPLLRSVVWALFGERMPEQTAAFDEASVLRHLDARFPPAFISAGNGDPLLSQSEALARRLAELGVVHETLFFPPDREPRLPHEYQFLVGDPAGPLALERAMAFAKARTAAP